MPNLIAELTPTGVRFTFPGTVIQNSFVSRHEARIFWHPADRWGISEKYRRSVEEWVAEHP